MLQIEWFPAQGKVDFHDSIYKRMLLSDPSFIAVCLLGIVIILGIVGLLR